MDKNKVVNILYYIQFLGTSSVSMNYNTYCFTL